MKLIQAAGGPLRRAELQDRDQDGLYRQARALTRGACRSHDKKMNRRHFLKIASAASLALGAFNDYSQETAGAKKRAGLIGCGWYGKSDLFRLIQVAPVEVVSLCDVDSRMLSDAADLVATRQISRKKPRASSSSSTIIARTGRSMVLDTVIPNSEISHTAGQVFVA